MTTNIKGVGNMVSSDARLRAVAKYDAKTYKLYGIKLRLEEDADIIKAIENAKANGISYRDWLRQLWDGASDE